MEDKRGVSEELIREMAQQHFKDLQNTSEYEYDERSVEDGYMKGFRVAATLAQMASKLMYELMSKDDKR